MYIRDPYIRSFSEKTTSRTNLILDRSDRKSTSFWTGQIAKAHRTHPVNPVLKRAHFLVTFSRASWHDTRQVTVCLLPHSLVIGEDCLYTKFSTCTAVVRPYSSVYIRPCTLGTRILNLVLNLVRTCCGNALQTACSRLRVCWALVCSLKQYGYSV